MTRCSVLVGKSIECRTFDFDKNAECIPVKGRIIGIRVTGSWPEKTLRIIVADEKRGKVVCVIILSPCKYLPGRLSDSFILEENQPDTLHRGRWWIGEIFYEAAVDFALSD